MSRARLAGRVAAPATRGSSRGGKRRFLLGPFSLGWSGRLARLFFPWGRSQVPPTSPLWPLPLDPQPLPPRGWRAHPQQGAYAVPTADIDHLRTSPNSILAAAGMRHRNTEGGVAGVPRGAARGGRVEVPANVVRVVRHQPTSSLVPTKSGSARNRPLPPLEPPLVAGAATRPARRARDIPTPSRPASKRTDIPPRRNPIPARRARPRDVTLPARGDRRRASAGRARLPRPTRLARQRNKPACQGQHASRVSETSPPAKAITPRASAKQARLPRPSRLARQRIRTPPAKAITLRASAKQARLPGPSRLARQRNKPACQGQRAPRPRRSSSSPCRGRAPRGCGWTRPSAGGTRAGG